MKIYKNVAVAGAGGIGSFLVHYLHDFGFKRKQFDYIATTITIFDDDIVDTTNLLHQNFSQADLTTLKVDVLAKRYGLDVKRRFMEEKDFQKFDLVCCCVDSMVFRKQLYTYAFQNPKFEFIDGRCTSRKGLVTNNEIPESELTKFISDSQERGSCLLQQEKENKTAHVLPAIIAAMMTQVFLNKTRGDSNLYEKHVNL